MCRVFYTLSQAVLTNHTDKCAQSVWHGRVQVKLACYDNIPNTSVSSYVNIAFDAICDSLVELGGDKTTNAGFIIFSKHQLIWEELIWVFAFFRNINNGMGEKKE